MNIVLKSTLPPGIEGTLLVVLIDDNLVEGNEVFLLMANAMDNRVIINEVNITIIDNDG